MLRMSGAVGPVPSIALWFVQGEFYPTGNKAIEETEILKCA
jgi:hypothetical protein